MVRNCLLNKIPLCGKFQGLSISATWLITGCNYPKSYVFCRKVLDSFAGYQTIRLNPLDTEKLSLGKSEILLSSYRHFKAVRAKD